MQLQSIQIYTTGTEKAAVAAITSFHCHNWHLGVYCSVVLATYGAKNIKGGWGWGDFNMINRSQIVKKAFLGGEICFRGFGKVTQNCWGNEKTIWGNDSYCWGNEPYCWGNDPYCCDDHHMEWFGLVWSGLIDHQKVDRLTGQNVVFIILEPPV